MYTKRSRSLSLPLSPSVPPPFLSLCDHYYQKTISPRLSFVSADEMRLITDLFQHSRRRSNISGNFPSETSNFPPRSRGDFSSQGSPVCTRRKKSHWAVWSRITRGRCDRPIPCPVMRGGAMSRYQQAVSCMQSLLARYYADECTR